MMDQHQQQQQRSAASSPRMRRFAERLAVIQISLDPPSPPEFALQSPDEHEEAAATAPVPFWAQPGYEHCFRPIEDSLLLQVCVGNCECIWPKVPYLGPIK
jgi:hypothetical protein